MNLLEKLETAFLKSDVPDLKVGQTVRVHLNIVEGDKERIQVYEGVVIGKRGRGHRETVTVRKVSYGVGVERVFPLHSPLIQKITVVREGKVRRAKLYFLRARSGRASRLTDKKVKETAEETILKPPPTSPVSEPSLAEAPSPQGLEAVSVGSS